MLRPTSNILHGERLPFTCESGSYKKALDTLVNKVVCNNAAVLVVGSPCGKLKHDGLMYLRHDSMNTNQHLIAAMQLPRLPARQTCSPPGTPYPMGPWQTLQRI